MKRSAVFGMLLAGSCAGIVNGLFGAGGGMILVPLLRKYGSLDKHSLFPGSIAVMLPICTISLILTAMDTPLPWSASLPYLLGGAVGGILAGVFGKRIPVLWLHRILGFLILWGGIRYLC